VTRLRVGLSGSILGMGRDISLRHRIQTVSGVRPAFNPMDAWGSFPGLKRPGREDAEVENVSSYTFSPPYVFMAQCLTKHRDNYFICTRLDTCISNKLHVCGTTRHLYKIYTPLM